MPAGADVKTCEYCGSEVAWDILVCPNCAAHFPDPPPRQPMTGLPAPDRSARPFAPLPPTYLDGVFSRIGRAVAVGCLLYVVAMIMGTMFMGLMSRDVVLLVAAGLVVLAVVIVRRAWPARTGTQGRSDTE